MAYTCISRNQMCIIACCLQALTVFTVGIGAMTSDKQIINSVSNPDALSFFQMMPDGQMMINVEYDLLMSVKEYRALHGKSSGRDKRKAAKNINVRWQKCRIYYEIDESLGPNTRELIANAMDVYRKFTCLEFVENTWRSSRIQFKSGEGCKSQLGMQRQPQPLILGRGCRTLGIIIHEIGHAIGLVHEHMRPDRDSYIVVNSDVIPSRFRNDFEKYDSNIVETHSVPYDYTSIMHYGDTIPGSIVTLDTSFQDKIGQRDGLSFYDISILNEMYGCAGMVCFLKKKCPFGGIRLSKPYKHYRKCQCLCNSGNIADPLVACYDESTVQPPTKPIITPKPIAPVKMGCFDIHDNCAQLRAEGKCMSNLEQMMDMCAKTCGSCGRGEGMCMDKEKACPMAAVGGFCDDPDFKEVMIEKCRASCNLCAKPPTPCEIETLIMSDNPANSSDRLGDYAPYLTLAYLVIQLLSKV